MCDHQLGEIKFLFSHYEPAAGSHRAVVKFKSFIWDGKAWVLFENNDGTTSDEARGVISRVVNEGTK